MSQTWPDLISGQTQLGSLYEVLNNRFAALRTQFSGPSAPSSPATHQVWMDTAGATPRLKIWSGTAWVDITDYLFAFTALNAETVAARGAAASLAARLGVALNPDGTLKAAAPAGGWWNAEPDAVSYNAANSFIVAGDKAAIYLARRAVRLTQTANALGHVVSAAYNVGSDETTVTVDCAVDAGLSAVEYGQPPDNEPVIGTLAGVTIGGDSELRDYWETKTAPASSGGALTLDLNAGPVFEVALTENVTALTISNPAASGRTSSFTLILTQGSTVRAITWPVAVKWPGGEAPDISTANAVYILTFMTTNAGATWYGFLAGSEMS